LHPNSEIQLYQAVDVHDWFDDVWDGGCTKLSGRNRQKIITPPAPVWLTGYANREKPATGVVQDLWAKAVLIQDISGNRVVIITTDLLGLSHEISESVAAKLLDKYGLKRSQIMLNSSHTHSGPMVWPCLSMIAEYGLTEQQQVSGYTIGLIDVLVNLVDSAMANRIPMTIAAGHGSAGFAANRRQVTDKGIVGGVNPTGPVDHDVPVLKFADLSGNIKAVLFGYACHNTTVVGDNYLVNGDYAGFAKAGIEQQFPGATAMFVLGCAGDQNPNPRGTIALAEQHGKSLADAVLQTMSLPLTSVHPTIGTAFTTVDLDFKPVDIKVYEKDLLGSNKFLQRRAKLMLEAYNKGWKTNSYPYSVQAIRFGKEFTMLAMSGEVVIDYDLRAKKTYPKEPLFVAGYSNEVMCYIPSKRVLQEGGYEAESNMIYYGMPGPFADSIEEKYLLRLIW